MLGKSGWCYYGLGYLRSRDWKGLGSVDASHRLRSDGLVFHVAADVLVGEVDNLAECQISYA
jgi:hypothetical protein